MDTETQEKIGIKHYNEIEKSLFNNRKKLIETNVITENQIILTNDDFRDGKLKISGYTKLVDQCNYIPYGVEVEVVVPKQFEPEFRPHFEKLATDELLRIKGDRRDTLRIAMICFFISAVLISSLWYLRKVDFVHEMVMIFGWVSMWTAVEKWFFDHNHLRDRRYNILQLLASHTVAR
jgi:hypothetical protein